MGCRVVPLAFADVAFQSLQHGAHDSFDAAVDRVGKVVPDALDEFLAAQLHWCLGWLPSVVVDAADQGRKLRPEVRGPVDGEPVP
jgi:hypothetical protein